MSYGSGPDSTKCGTTSLRALLAPPEVVHSPFYALADDA